MKEKASQILQWPALFFIIFLLIHVSTVSAGDSKAPLSDVMGDWNFQTSNNWSKGVCPGGKASKGICKIEQKGDAFTLVFSSGMTCSPKSMCIFKCDVKGGVFNCSNSDKVDNEGGTVTNTLTFALSSSNEAKGKGASRYTHPGGMVCDWGSDIKLWK